VALACARAPLHTAPNQGTASWTPRAGKGKPVRTRAHIGFCKSAIIAALAVAAVLTIVSTAAYAQSPSPPPAVEKKWAPSIDFEGKLGTQRNLGEADILLPLWQDPRSMLFANVRARLDDNDGREGNYGLGFRHMTDWGWNLGAYSYFDRRRSENLNYYNQVTVGVEALSLDWDARFNAYVPEGRRTHQVDSFNTAEVSGTTVLFHDGEEKSLRGFDAEAGWRAPLFTPEALQQLRLYAGGYTFYADGINNRVQGPRGRIEFTSEETPYLWEGSRLTLGTEVQNDGPRGTQAFFLARLRIPLQFWDTPKTAQLTPMERRMTDRIVRDVDIVSQAGNFGAVETATQTSGGKTFSVVNSSSTTGANLPTAVTNAGANSTVILSGSFNTTAQTVMQGGQTLMAGPIGVRSASGRTATLVTSATISGSNVAGSVLQPTDNTTVQGLTVTATGSGAAAVIGIQPNNTSSNISLINNTVIATQTGTNAAFGIALSQNTGITISGNIVTATGAAGQIARALTMAAGSTATITGNTLSASGGATNNFASVAAGNTVNAGSTGNVATAGTCSNSGTGTISFTNGTTC